MFRIPMTRRNLLRSAAAASAAMAAPRFALSADGKKLRVRVETDIHTLDPLNIVTANDLDAGNAIFSSLIKIKPGDSWEWTLDAAESIEAVDPTHIAFTLRPGIEWTNDFGELSADDVKFSFERIADPKNESPYQGEWATLQEVQVTGPLFGGIEYTVRSFGIVVLAGLGNLAGVIAAAFGIGAAEQLVGFVVSVQFQRAFIYLVVIAILVWRSLRLRRQRRYLR